MPESYSYSKRRSSDALVRELDVDCPCGEGVLTLILDERRQVRRWEVNCRGKHCGHRYANGEYADAIKVAIAAADKAEAEGPTEAQLSALYDTANSSEAERRELDGRVSREAGR